MKPENETQSKTIQFKPGSILYSYFVAENVGNLGNCYP